jgi:hypothetical protein
MRKGPVKIGRGGGSIALRHLSRWQAAISVIGVDP